MFPVAIVDGGLEHDVDVAWIAVTDRTDVVGPAVVRAFVVETRWYRDGTRSSMRVRDQAAGKRSSVTGV
ncbi:hypothetical protein [Natrinema caseinilyticum]|uniref:hypothetical protein n=1 Tax=Natrinema caseinilyticum TaxID=2961570 RepID=UPI0020C4FC71|nr:hypothetical protein [Natrinema caseinilyticum]